MKNIKVILIVLTVLIITGTVVYKKAGRTVPTPSENSVVTAETTNKETSRPQPSGNYYDRSRDVCKEKTNEAKEILQKCRSLQKGSDEFKECANSYKTVKNQATEACRASALTEDEIREAIAKWEKQVNHCKGKENPRCATALRMLGHYQFQIEEMTSQASNQKADHKKSLDYFVEFIDEYPNDIKTPDILYKAATVLDESGEKKKATDLYKRLIKDFPDYGKVPKAQLRITELSK